MINNGYWGKMLRVNLSSKSVIEEEIKEDFVKKYIGGSGFGAKILYDEVPSSVKPYDQENKIIFATGPFQATKITGAAKFSIITRSPLTGIFGDAAAGASFGIELKNSGYDALIIEGKADRPVYLWINNNNIQFMDASRIWNLDSYKTIDTIKDELDNDKVSIACIGPAGEKMVAIACIVVDKHSFAGRCGLGAVMGSKNLKAVVVKGNKKCPVYDLDRLKKLVKKIGKTVHDNTIEMHKHGTPSAVIKQEELGDMPVKYWKGDVWKEGAQKIGAPNYTKVLKAKPLSCKYCTIGCHRLIEIEEPKKYSLKGAGPEYETLAMIGSNILLDDVKALAKANDLCNRYGIDTISTGAFIGFTMECYEKGILTPGKAEGFSISWGDADKIIKMIHKIGKKEGYIGKLFCNGIKGAVEKLGKETEKIAVEVKGLDFPGHDPRAYFSLAINYATGNRGACHERGNPLVASMGALLPVMGIKNDVDRFAMKNSEFITAKYQDYSALEGALVHCKFMLFGGMNLEEILDVLNAVTGWNWEIDELIKTSERIFTIERMVNIMYGITKKDEKMPEKMYVVSKNGGRIGKAPTKGEFENTLLKYYKLRDWDNEGVPKNEKLTWLDIN